jgi:hypothetical protein
MRKADALPLTPDDRSQLEAWSKGRTIPARLVERSRILLLLADGTVIADTMPLHRHQEWLKFLKQIYRLVPEDKDIHIICDNYSSHKTPAVQAVGIVDQESIELDVQLDFGQDLVPFLAQGMG